MPALESPTNLESLADDSSRGEFADFPPDTTWYFEAWLESLRPSSAPASQFNFEGTLRLDCYVTGFLRSETGTLIVSETAELQANIFVATAIVDGLVRGDISATERVELGSKARVTGNIETPALTIQPGAMFEGQCHSLPPRDGEQVARSAVDDSTGSKGSSRRHRSKPDQQEETEAMALAAGR